MSPPGEYSSGNHAGLDETQQAYIESQTSLVERKFSTLKNGRSFAVMDSAGDMGLFAPVGPEGLYFCDTRHLSIFALTFVGARPLLLSSTIQDDNASLSIDLTNSDVHEGGHLEMPRDLVAIHRTKFIWRETIYERVGLRNYDTRERSCRLEFAFDADFRDLFEVRGMKRAARGEIDVETQGVDRVIYRYKGLDDVVRRTELCFTPAPAQLSEHRALFDICLAPGERRSILVTVGCSESSVRADDPGKPRQRVEPFIGAYRDLRRSLRAATADIVKIDSSNELFDEIIRRSTTDIYMLVSETEHGPYPYAGIPWYSTPFGRDGLIAAMLMLWADPGIARGVLHYLAMTQATKHDPSVDARPGKFCTRLAQARWPCSARSPSASITAPWTLHLSLSCWRGSISNAPGTARRSRRSGRISRRR